MLGLVAGSASFADTNETGKPAAFASIISKDKVKLIVAPMNTKARVDLTDNYGHVLYTSDVNLALGIQKMFDISNLELGVYKLSVSVGNERTVKTLTFLKRQVSSMLQCRNSN